MWEISNKHVDGLPTFSIFERVWGQADFEHLFASLTINSISDKI